MYRRQLDDKRGCSEIIACAECSQVKFYWTGTLVAERQNPQMDTMLIQGFPPPTYAGEYKLIKHGLICLCNVWEGISFKKKRNLSNVTFAESEKSIRFKPRNLLMDT